MEELDVIVIGAGLTGLTIGCHLKRAGKKVLLLEKDSVAGGQIRTMHRDGFVYELGPNTGSVSTPEVKELFELLGDRVELEVADKEASNRLIWKGNTFHPIPSSLSGALFTPLFTWYDKFRILGEPFRKKGIDPNESVGSLAQRRLGKSYLQYAVDPFLGGVYAGDPCKLVTRYALPKLYNLEADHGSFVKGTIHKMKQPKTERDRKATKEVFSAKGGFGNLIKAMSEYISSDNIHLSANIISLKRGDDGVFDVCYDDEKGTRHVLRSRKVVTTVGAYALGTILSDASVEDVAQISKLQYAPVIEVAVGYKQIKPYKYKAFGGLVPSIEKRKILGILFPSDCFQGRAPQGGALYTIFMAGIKHAEYLDMTDDELKEIALCELNAMLNIDPDIKPDLIHISKYPYAIAQYYADSGERFDAIDRIERAFPGLYLGGSIRDGIGMAHRITQGTHIAQHIIDSL
ncbi:protoporphyrinogen oxidase [Porphyromonas pogonae]|uniref:protoporphyrinogen oxidase n=1 Tax=Porphyromonas pogonae TaxID=867595 RepID=UPI002E7A7EEF|nr:protoporphyrinogen oxidase [Porphyromonas pogonae]